MRTTRKKRKKLGIPLKSPVIAVIKKAILSLIILKRHKTGYSFDDFYISDSKYGG